ARINEYLDMDRKTYRCEMILGLTTETMDIWGEVVDDQRDQARGITEEEILKAMESIHGMILQTPPKYSAVRIDGRRLYDYARSGDEVKIPKRPVVIYSLDLVHYDPEKGRVMFDVVCSKGTYIRSICHDVGQTLGVGATMSFLVRTATGAFTLENAATPEQLQEDWKKYVMPADLPLPHLGRLDLRKGRGAWFSNGGWLMNSDLVNREEPGVKITDEAVMKHIGVDEKLLNSYRVYEDGLFLGTALWKEDQKRYIADKVFRHEGF
ncbi:MAG: hypothetical protein IJB07_04925, partial [Firmicutes bacterium]|nr:hypothetical protein [Bacillota bacterium]